MPGERTKANMGLVFLMALLLSACGGKQSTIRNHESGGNLEATRGGECVELDVVSNQWTAADLMVSAKRCAEEGQFNRAIALLFPGLVYGRYDAMRVSDRSARQASTVLAMNVTMELSEDEQAGFQERFNYLMNDDPQFRAEGCQNLARMGPPDYFPRYMIQHGMAAFTGGSGDGLLADFEHESAWQTVMSGYAQCG